MQALQTKSAPNCSLFRIPFQMLNSLFNFYLAAAAAIWPAKVDYLGM